MIKVKDIKFTPLIGKWYEYKPQPSAYSSEIFFGEISDHDAGEMLDIHYKWAVQVVEKFKEIFGMEFPLHQVLITQQKYSEYLGVRNFDALSVPVTLGKGLDAMLCMDYHLVHKLLNKSCGGNLTNVLVKTEPLTNVESVIMQQIIQEMVVKYSESWLSVFNVGNISEQNFVSPKMKILENVRKDAEVISFICSLSFGDEHADFFEILFPSGSLESLYKQYKLKKMVTQKSLTVYLSPDSTQGIKVPVNIKIGHTFATINEIMSLKSGDVFMLNEKISDSVFLMVGNNENFAEFYGVLGQKQSKYAVKLLEKKAGFYEEDTEANHAPAEDAVFSGNVRERSVVREPLPEMVAQAPEVVAEVTSQEIGQPAEVLSEPVAIEKTDEEQIEIKDSLLDEFSAELSKSQDDEEFTWDIDDLK